MSAPAQTRRDLFDEFASRFEELVSEYRERFEEQAPTAPAPGGSETVAFAVAAGLPIRMAYTLAETSRITGVPVETLRSEHEAGRLSFVIPDGRVRGSRVTVREMDRWMAENSR